MKAVIYLRVSTKEQAERATRSPPRPRPADGSSPIKVGSSPTSTWTEGNRPAAPTGRSSRPCWLASRRLARNLEDHAAVRAALRKAHVQLHSVTESLEDSASGKLVEGILASIAEPTRPTSVSPLQVSPLQVRFKRGSGVQPMRTIRRRGTGPWSTPSRPSLVTACSSGSRRGRRRAMRDLASACRSASSACCSRLGSGRRGQGTP